MKPKSTLLPFLALAGSSLLAISSASAQTTYYWDGNDATSGFGTAGGIWADPTSGTLTSGWSTSATGVTTVNGNSVTTALNDSLNFGTNTALYGLAAGTITVSGTVNAGSITQGSQSGTITLSGGTINLASTATITTNSTVVIDSLITGAGTSLTKGGAGTLRLTNTANTYTGATLIGASTNGVLEATFLANGGVASSIGASSSAAGNLVLSNINTGVLRYIGTTNASSDRLFTLGNQQGYPGGFEVTGTGTLNLTSTGAVAFAQANQTRIFSLGGTNTGQNVLNPQLIDNGTGALSFIKNGTGNWFLANNSNSYTGTTTLNAGTLSVSKMANYGTVSAIGQGTAGAGIVFNGGALNYTGSGDSTNRLIQLTSNGTILNNGTGALNFTDTGNFNVQVSTTTARTLSLGGSNGGTISGAIQNNNTGTISLTKTDAGTWTLAGANSYSGLTTISGGTLALSGSGTLGNGTGGLTMSGGSLNMGGLSRSVAAVSVTGAAASGDTISNGNLTGTSYAASNTTGNAIISANLLVNAAAGFTKTGAGTVTLSGANTYTGTTTLTAGNTQVGVNSVGSVGAITSSALGTGTLTFNGGGISSDSTTARTILNAITFTGNATLGDVTNTGKLTFAANASLGATRTLTVNSTSEFSGIISGTGFGITKAGLGDLILSGANSYTGATSINAGTLVLDMASGGSLNSATALTGTANTSGGTFLVKGASSGSSAQTVGAWSTGNNTAMRIAIDPNGGTGTTLTLGNAWTVGSASSMLIDYSSASTGTRQVITAGATTGTALSNGLYGRIMVKDSNGVVGFATRAAGTNQPITRFDDTAGTTLANNSNVAATNFTTLNTVYTSGTLNWSNAITTRSVNSLTIDTTNNGGIIDMGAATNTLTVTSGGILFKGGNNATLTGGQFTTGYSFHVTGSSTLTVNTPTNGTNLVITKDGTGTLVLGGNSTTTGAIGVNEGTLKLGAAGDGTNTPLGTTGQSTRINTGATLDMGGITLSTAEALTLYGTGVSGNGALINSGAAATWSGAITLASDASIVSNNNISLTAATSVTGAFNLTLGGTATGSSITGIIGTTTGGVTKTGTGTWTLSGANTYTGLTRIAGGTLALGHATNTLADTGAVNVDGGTLSIGGNSDTVGPVTLTSGSITGTGGTLTALSYDVRSGSASAILGGSGALTKSTAGTVTLSGANTYSGATTVSAGTLYVTGALSSSAVTVQANGTVGSNGSAGNLGNGLTIETGGNLDLAGATLGLNSTGILSLTGGTLTLGNLTFQDLVGWNWASAAEGTYKLIDGTFDIIWGSTAFLSEETAYDFGNGKRGYFTSGSLNVVIIPEPCAALLGGLGLLALLRRRRD